VRRSEVDLQTELQDAGVARCGGFAELAVGLNPGRLVPFVAFKKAAPDPMTTSTIAAD
jgi:hypothetical protein